MRACVISVLSWRQFQLEVVTQEPRQALFDLLGLGLGSGEPEQVIVCVPDIPQPPVAGIAGIPAGQAAQLLAQLRTARGRRAGGPARSRSSPGCTRCCCLRSPSGVFRNENCLDELVQPVQVNIGQDW